MKYLGFKWRTGIIFFPWEKRKTRAKKTTKYQRTLLSRADVTEKKHKVTNTVFLTKVVFQNNDVVRMAGESQRQYAFDKR